MSEDFFIGKEAKEILDALNEMAWFECSIGKISNRTDLNQNTVLVILSQLHAIGKVDKIIYRSSTYWVLVDTLNNPPNPVRVKFNDKFKCIHCQHEVNSFNISSYCREECCPLLTAKFKEHHWVKL